MLLPGLAADALCMLCLYGDDLIGFGRASDSPTTITIDTQCHPQIVAGIQLGSTLPTIVGLLGNSVDTKTCSELNVIY